MPYLKIQTNCEITAQRRPQILHRLSTTVAAALGKSENYVMVALEGNVAMLFAGDDAPLAFVELKSLALPEARTAELSAQISGAIEETLQVPPSRIYIEFNNAERHMWGWNGATFG